MSIYLYPSRSIFTSTYLPACLPPYLSIYLSTYLFQKKVWNSEKVKLSVNKKLWKFNKMNLLNKISSVKSSINNEVNSQVSLLGDIAEDLDIDYNKL